jgi:hypothetical protein
MELTYPKRLFVFLLCVITLTACSSGGIFAEATETPTVKPTMPPTATLLPTVTKMPPTITPEPTNIFEPTDAPEPTGWDRYLPRTMSELTDIVKEYIEADALEEAAIYLEFSPAYQHPSRVPMIYTGEFRQVPDLHQTMLSLWLGNVAPNLTEAQQKELFKTEVLFTDSGNEYWMPIQEPVLDYMKEEYKPGDEIGLYTLWLGAVTGEVGPEMVFVINEYEWE